MYEFEVTFEVLICILKDLFIFVRFVYLYLQFVECNISVYIVWNIYIYMYFVFVCIIY